MKSIIFSYTLMCVLFFSCGTKNEKENSQKEEKTTEKETKKEEKTNEGEEKAEPPKKKQENWAGVYEFYDSENEGVTLTITNKNEVKLMRGVTKGGFVVMGTLEANDNDGKIIYQEYVGPSSLDKEYQKGDVYAPLTKNNDFIEVNNPSFGTMKLKKTDQVPTLD